MRKDPQLLIDDFGSTHPNALLLAEVVSIAVRVEPELLRMARLILVPEANAGDEADLWFSPLVEVRNILGFVFYPEVAQILRERLANKIELLNDTWYKLFTKVHENISQALYVEEEITWRALKNPSDPEIENLLKRTLATIVQEDDSNGVSHWILRALPNLPNHVLQLEITQLLKWVALLRLGDDSLLGVEDSAISESMPEWVSQLIPSNLGTFKIGVRFVEDGMEFGNLDSLKDAETLELPATNPLLMDISWIKDSNQRQSKLIWFKYNETNYLRVDVDEVELRTLSGDKYKLSLNPIYRALKCAVVIYREVSKKLQSDIADTLSIDFERAVNSRLYDSENEFVEFMEEEIDLLKVLPEEIKDLAIEKDLNNYIAVINELADTIKSKNVLKIADKQEEVCFFARELRRATSLYRALKCTAVNFAEVADILENKNAMIISAEFEKAINNEVYEDENEFIDFMKGNFALFRVFEKEIEDLATKETLKKYISSVEKLTASIRSEDALKIAVQQEEVCSSAKQLEIHLVV